MRIFTGTRCVTFTKLPLALSGGSKENLAPVASLRLSIEPLSLRSHFNIYFFTRIKFFQLVLLEIGYYPVSGIVYDGEEGSTCLYILTFGNILSANFTCLWCVYFGVSEFEFGLLNVRDVIDITNDEYNKIVYAIESLVEEDKGQLKPVYELLDQAYDYGVLRCVQASI